jgi:TonB family protein
MNFSLEISDNKHAAKLCRALSFLIVFTFLAIPLFGQMKKRGKVTTYHTNGKNESAGKVKNYKKQGLWKYWSETGVLTKTITWKDDVQNGLYTEYYADGKKSVEGNYVSGAKDGTWYSWYSDGKVMSKLNYKYAKCDDAECYDGVQQYWYENGQLREQTKYVNFRLVYREKWYANGKRRLIENYKDGLPDGTWRKYPEPSESKDTLPASIDNYVKGKREGVHLGYAYGRLSEEYYYKDDKLEGTYKKWDQNSQLGVSENYVGGKLDGLCRYFNYGKCIREVTYEKGRINGEEKEYDGRGELYRISWYKKGTIDSSYNYHKNGKISISRTYKYYPGFVKTEEFSEYTEWDSSGVLLLRGTYHFEMKDKEWTTYYANGKVKSITPYSAGKIKGVYKKWHANGKKMIEMECDGLYVVTSPKVWDEKGKALKEGTKAYNEIVDSSKPGEIYNDPKRYKNNRRDESPHFEDIGDLPRIVIEEDENEILFFAEVMPEFPGGAGALTKFVQDNINYPPIAKEQRKTGTVYMSYVVEKDGSVTNITLMKPVAGAPEFTKEATRVISLFPKHTPGLMNGKPVRVRMVIPVKFILK